MNNNCDLRKASSKSYSRGTEKIVTTKDIELGSILRIADAVEIMAKDRAALEKENACLKASVTYYRGRSDRLDRRLSTTKGLVTRYKNQIKKLRAGQ